MNLTPQELAPFTKNDHQMKLILLASPLTNESFDHQIKPSHHKWSFTIWILHQMNLSLNEPLAKWTSRHLNLSPNEPVTKRTSHQMNLSPNGPLAIWTSKKNNLSPPKIFTK